MAHDDEDMACLAIEVREGFDRRRRVAGELRRESEGDAATDNLATYLEKTAAQGEAKFEGFLEVNRRLPTFAGGILHRR